jgi:iron complex outermembrane recepter protein
VIRSGLVIALLLAVTREAKAQEPPASTNEQDEDYATVRVKNPSWASPRGVGDTRVKRELLEASPRLMASELLSSAPGFFVDHEDGEGLANDVYLRGFDLEHGSGIEMRVGSTPINIPMHIRGQGYADVNFIIPEVVRSIRVLQGPYDPRQGDAGIVGSAYFDLGVERRGYQLKTTYGSFAQTRVTAIAAPKGENAETFAAASVRQTKGFGGSNRGTTSGSTIGQYSVDLGAHNHLRFLGTAWGVNGSRAGVVRQDDVDAGRIAITGTYPHFAQGQGIHSSRLIASVDFDHDTSAGAHFEVAPWVMWTDFRARQNFAGALETSQRNPSLSGLGDLFETTNRESAAGVSSRLRSLPVKVGQSIEVITEPGLLARYGHTHQTKSLLVPSSEELRAWDRRINARIDSIDVGGYLDLDVRFFRRLRLSGGPRADVLHAAVLGANGPNNDATGIAFSPRATLAYSIGEWLTPSVSYGEGFRSIDGESIRSGRVDRPFSKVRSFEGGALMKLFADRYTASVAIFETRVANELVFSSEAGGLETQKESTRRGFVGSLIAKPASWLLLSSSLSFTRAVYDTRIPGVAHLVPSVPPVLLRTDLTIKGVLGTVRGAPVFGRTGVGYTFLAPRNLTDTIRSTANHVVNANASVRYKAAELGIDVYNLLGLRYADDSAFYASNWSLLPGQQRASLATHLTAAPPTTVLATVTLYF